MRLQNIHIQRSFLFPFHIHSILCRIMCARMCLLFLLLLFGLFHFIHMYLYMYSTPTKDYHFLLFFIFAVKKSSGRFQQYVYVRPKRAHKNMRGKKRKKISFVIFLSDPYHTIPDQTIHVVLYGITCDSKYKWKIVRILIPLFHARLLKMNEVRFRINNLWKMFGSIEIGPSVFLSIQIVNFNKIQTFFSNIWKHHFNSVEISVGQCVGFFAYERYFPLIINPRK